MKQKELYVAMYKKNCLVLVFNGTHPVHQSRRQTHHLREGVEGKIFSLHHFLANTISSQDIQHHYVIQKAENNISSK